MKLTAPSLLLLAVLGFCWARQHHHFDNKDDDEPELVAQPSRFGSLWPLPQKVQLSQVALKLTGLSFRIVDGKESTVGASCALLQDAYRR